MRASKPFKPQTTPTAKIPDIKERIRGGIKMVIWFQINSFIPLNEKLLQFDWLRAVVYQLNLKYLHVEITNLLRVVV